jgi:hypothetical protein
VRRVCTGRRATPAVHPQPLVLYVVPVCREPSAGHSLTHSRRARGSDRVCRGPVPAVCDDVVPLVRPRQLQQGQHRLPRHVGHVRSLRPLPLAPRAHCTAARSLPSLLRTECVLSTSYGATGCQGPSGRWQSGLGMRRAGCSSQWRAGDGSVAHQRSVHGLGQQHRHQQCPLEPVPVAHRTLLCSGRHCAALAFRAHPTVRARAVPQFVRNTGNYLRFKYQVDAENCGSFQCDGYVAARGRGRLLAALLPRAF